MKRFNRILALTLAVLGIAAGSASAQISISTVFVGDAGNAADPSTTYGSVSYPYNIGMYEVTLNQYTAFLNAVAKADPLQLWNGSGNMALDQNVRGINRSGSSGSYTYTVIGNGNRPVTYVSWFDAARFVNWLQNGQPTGAQGPGTTETGTYTLNGAVSGVAFPRNPVPVGGVQYALPTENEWYKAAYYDQSLNANSGGYWLYPMRTNGVPHSMNGSASDPYSGNFFYDDGIANGYNGGYAVTQSPVYSSTQNYLTSAGAFSLASSYYGTFDQGGNVREWTEGISASSRVVRGGAWNQGDVGMTSGNRAVVFPFSEVESIGFRIIYIPEPSLAALIGLGVLSLTWRRRSKV